MENPTFYDVISIPLAVLGFGIGSYQFYLGHQFGRGTLMAAGAAIAAVVGILKSTAAIRQQKKLRQLHDLEGCLYTLWAGLGGAGDDNIRLRITIYKPVTNGTKLEQLTEYVGAHYPKLTKIGRHVPAQSGVVGRCLRLKVPLTMARQSDNTEEFVRELMEYAFIESDARAVDTSNYAWMAVPLFEKVDGHDEVRGVVYLDSTDKEFFTKERQEIAINACLGISLFVNRRYN